jgi:hypothetical protein
VPCLRQEPSKNQMPRLLARHSQRDVARGFESRHGSAVRIRFLSGRLLLEVLIAAAAGGPAACSGGSSLYTSGYTALGAASSGLACIKQLVI